MLTSSAIAQPDRWQQRVKYTMNIKMDAALNRFHGTQKLEYQNNSPDTLSRVFYHLYWNAFQPNSMMDMRSRRQGSIVVGSDDKGHDFVDWDPRVKDRILHLQPNEIGYQKILSLKMNGVPQPFKVRETILEVTLSKPILPKTTATFDIEFEAQVPLQVRRSGRDNPRTGVQYSMSQWYPKMCEYDYEGWHPTPYVGREFYGVWGDFDVTITVPSKYTLGGTGYLQNPNSIGHGYEDAGTKVAAQGDMLTWHFIAPNVHDFMWAADTAYQHISKKIKDGLVVHVLYKTKDGSADAWKSVLAKAETAWPFVEKTFGAYPYKQYSFIDGGDGGMEYPMATLIAGPSAWLHEWLHSWYYGMLGTNESEYPWMDEGFTDYATERVAAFLKKPSGFEHEGSYGSYFDTQKSGLEEALSTHDDHYNTNFAHFNVYSKGAVFVEQLGYIVGDAVRDKILLEYYREWRFKHPNANDFIRVAEKASNMKLDWYLNYWITSTKTIDYGVDSVWEVGGKTKIRIKRIGLIPMPIDAVVEFKDGSKGMAYIPMYLMFGEKPVEDTIIPRTTFDAWKWTDPVYTFEIDKRLVDIKSIEIDPSQRLADVERKNNKLVIPW